MGKGDKPVTYEEAHAPHYIAHRKGWLSLHTGEGAAGAAVLGAVGRRSSRLRPVTQSEINTCKRLLSAPTFSQVLFPDFIFVSCVRRVLSPSFLDGVEQRPLVLLR